MHPLMIGAFINSALYLFALALSGIAFGLHLVVALAILSMGLAFLCYADQLRQLSLPQPVAAWRVRLAMGLHMGSNLCGILAGVLLLVALFLHWRG